MTHPSERHIATVIDVRTRQPYKLKSWVLVVKAKPQSKVFFCTSIAEEEFIQDIAKVSDLDITITKNKDILGDFEYVYRFA